MRKYKVQKKHAIIPIFIPHYGCEYECVFCNQNKITGRTKIPKEEDVRNTVDEWLTTLRPKGENAAGTVELAFYGGSFTGIPIDAQSSYLSIAKEYKDSGLIDKIHMSTRPDYIDEEILTNLKSYGVDTIELGAQSFDDAVLLASNRGHTAKSTEKASALINEFGFELGIQLMVGLPGDSLKSSIYSAKKAADLAPSLARIYPTVMLKDTELLNMYLEGKYIPISQEEAVKRAKAMYLILENSGITIMRVGLKSTDVMNSSVIDSPSYHPAFRQLVEGSIARDRIEDLIIDNLDEQEARESNKEYNPSIKVDIHSSPSWFSNMIGNGGENKIYFNNKYPHLNIRYKVDDLLSDGDFKLVIKG